MERRHFVQRRRRDAFGIPSLVVVLIAALPLHGQEGARPPRPGNDVPEVVAAPKPEPVLDETGIGAREVLEKPSKDAAAEPEDSRISILILDVNLIEMPKGIEKILIGPISYEIARDSRLQVLTGQDIRRLSKFEADRVLAGCDDDSCASEIADALGADLVVFSTLGKLGTTYIFNMNLIDSQSSQSLKRVSREARDINQLRGVVASGSRELMASYLKTLKKTSTSTDAAGVESVAEKMVRVAPPLSSKRSQRIDDPPRQRDEPERPGEIVDPGPDFDFQPFLSVAWVAGGVGLGVMAIAGGTLFDLTASTSTNRKLDFQDFVGPTLLVTGVSLALASVFLNPFSFEEEDAASEVGAP